MSVMVEALTENIEKRESQDKPLFSYGFVVMAAVLYYMILLSIKSIGFSFVLTTITFQIFQYWKTRCRFRRIVSFVERKKEWYHLLLEYTRRKKGDDVNVSRLTELVEIEFSKNEMISEVRFDGIHMVYIPLSLVFGIMTSSVLSSLSNPSPEDIYFYYFCLFSCLMYLTVCIYFMIKIDAPINNRWYRLQMFEYNFVRELSKVWYQEEWIDKKLSFDIYFNKERNYILWIFYSCVSFGIMIIVWDYKMHTDPNDLYFRFHHMEDKILEIVEQKEKKDLLQI